MKMEHCALLSIENQMILVISCTVNRRTQKHWKTAYHTVAFAYKIYMFRNIKTALKDLKDAFIKRGCQSKIPDHHLERVMIVD